MSEAPSTQLRIEVVYALPGEQALVALEVAPGTTVEQAIGYSGIGDRFPGEDLGACAVGIWGSPVPRQRAVAAGDRIEIYRALAMDPREARRRLARTGRTMARTDDPL